MLRDVFYFGDKPNVHPREKFATDLNDARSKASSEHFWIINEFSDYKNFDWDFDFEFLADEDVWAEEHINVWPSQHQKDSGTWLVNTYNHQPAIIYRNDVGIVKRKNIKSSNWKIVQKIDELKFDFSWHPDPTDPPYIYIFPTTWNKVGGPQYHVYGAIEKKYINTQIGVTIPDYEKWHVPDNIDASDFNFTWVPHPEDPPYIYEFGTQWQKTGGPRYIVENATEVKYIEFQKAKALPTTNNWTIPKNLDITGFDFSWHPDNTSPPYIYNFATQWALTGGPVYTVDGATETKYLEYPSAIALPDKTNWKFDNKTFDVDSFDFSWHPYVEDQPYIYQFGTQHQKTGGPTYITPGVIPSSPIKYIDTRILKAKRLPNKRKFSILNNYKIKDFDYSWHPDELDEPYIYVFGNNQYPAEIMPTIEYVVPGAKQIKYVNEVLAVLDVDMSNWEVPDNIDTSGFDFSWKPNPKDPAYIYQFGTQWQKTGGPRYVVPDSTEVKFVTTQQVKALPTTSNWTIPNHVDTSNFDFSWHPDDTSPAYIYHFATQWALTGGPIYTVPGAVEKKYLEEPSAVALENKENWVIPKDIDTTDFDFSWHPYLEDQPYIYQFGTQHQKTGGPRYVTPGVIPTSPIKYIDTRILKAKKLINKKNFAILNNYKIKDFDYSWHPDDTDEPYIYVFGNNQYPAEVMPTIEYVVPGAKQIKYVSDVRAVLDVDMSNWEVPDNIDTSGFDFSWKPNPKDPPYIYQFGTQWQKTNGPRYVVPDATEVKYVTTQQVKALPILDNWTIPPHVDVSNFDFSWHPDDTSPPYIYHFATQWALTGGPVYTVPNALEKKYLEEPNAIALPNKENWHVPNDVDVSDFDFSWHPYLEDQPYIYQFGTQHQKTGGPKYITPGVIPSSPIKYIDTRILKAKKLPNKKNFAILNNYKIKDFDWSWHPDDTEEPYIYLFGNNHYPAEVMPTIEYVVPGATQIKYINNIKAILDVDMRNWEVPKDIDVSDFDFSWKPNPKDPAFIYQFGTQHQKTGGPKYIVGDATEIKYIDTQKAKKLKSMDNWQVPKNIDISEFDFSWHPDDTNPPYIYVFGTQWALSGGPKYVMPNATEKKYIDNILAKTIPNFDNWIIPEDIDTSSFDFSWHPYEEDEPYIYEFGTQWQKTGGPKYVAQGADNTSFTKYIDTRILKAKKLPNKTNWIIPKNIDSDSIDFSWHPDETEPAYIYEFATTLYDRGGPKYYAKGAKDNVTPIKYIDAFKAKYKSSRTNWQIPKNVDTTDFDFSWNPHPDDPVYIYEFATVWHDRGGPRYYAKGAKDNVTPVKYISDVQAKLKSDLTNWQIPDNININEFDFTWNPHPDDPPFIYEFGTQHQKTGGPKYIVPGAKEIKYIDTQRAQRLADKTFFKIITDAEIVSFDYSWHPDSTEEPYIYVFGNNQYKAEEMPTIEYRMPGATQKKFVNNIVAKLAPDKKYWQIPENLDLSDFDFSWKPNPNDPPYIYQFGTQHQKTGGPRYIVPDATEIKYVENIKVKILASKKHWQVENNVKIKDFDYSWHPDSTEEPYIYIFGNNQYPAEIMPTVKYIVPGAIKAKYVNDIVALLDINYQNYEIPKNIDTASFDFSWIPNPKDPPFIYQFGTQHQKTGGPKYIVPGATDVKYIENIKSVRKMDMTNYEIPENIDVSKFDFSWHPDELSPAYIYQFGTLVDKNDGPRYVTPGNKGEVVYLNRIERQGGIDIAVYEYFIETTLEDLIREHPNEIFWAKRKNIDYKNFDFEWRPKIVEISYELNFVHVFGSPDSELTQTYFVSSKMYNEGYKEFKFVEKDKKVDSEYLAELFIQPDIFLVDRGNSEVNERFDYLKSKFNNVQKTRFLNTWVDTINRCINRSSTELCWILNSELDYSDFDFKYYPNPWQMKMVHVFGTQWSHWGTTFLVNRETFSEDTKYIKIIEHLSNLNFVKDNNKKAKATNCLYDVYVIDHNNDNTIYVLDQLKNKVADKSITTIKYKDNYLDTFKEILKQVPEKKDHYIWICSSICDYTNFDFTYICDPFAREQLHVFPSDRQKYGDTFLVNVNKLKELIDNMIKLQDYDKINFNQHQRLERYSPPIIVSQFDTHVGSILQDFNFPYAIFVTEDNKDIQQVETESLNLWDSESKNIIITSTGGTSIVVPKEAKNYVETQLYDYPYIKTNNQLAKSKPLDIVFLSNGEEGAEDNYQHLQSLTKDLPNRLVRVDGVNGRVNAYHAALEASNTPWAFTVFAKLRVNRKFNWNWQPDRLQIPKHYIFHAKNPVNGLTYGHQAIIAYNKTLVLNNEGSGLDFTMDDPHETVEILSGTAFYNTDKFSTWRTAFREVIKLQSDNTDISKDRLNTWLTVAESDYAEYSILGAKDAIEYYKKVKGDFNKLKLSYEWKWLQSYFERKYLK